MGHSIPAGFQHYDISRDGKRFMMIKEEELPEAEGQINVVLSWFEELKRLVRPLPQVTLDLMRPLSRVSLQLYHSACRSLPFCGMPNANRLPGRSP